MATQLQDAQAAAIALLPSGDLGHSISDITKYTRQIVQATTVEEVSEALVGAGVPRDTAEGLMESEALPQLAQASRDTSAPREQDTLDQNPLEAVGDFLSQPWRAVEANILNAFRNREGEDVLASADISATGQVIINAADPEVRKAILAVLAVNPNIPEKHLETAAAQDNVASATSILQQSLDPAEIAALDDPALLYLDILTKNVGEESFEFLSSQSFKDRGIEVALHENHDQMIHAGYDIYMEEAPDGSGYEMLYISPDDDQQAINADNQDVGYYDAREAGVVRLRPTDSRKPIGIDTGGFIPSGRDINEVAGRSEGTVQDFYNLYGFEYTDVVNDMDFETLLRENLGLSEAEIDMFRRESERPELFEEYSDVDVTLHYQYLEGQHINRFIDMPGESFASVQKQYEAMGIGYSAGEYSKFDPEFMRVVNTTMAYANLNYEAAGDGFERAMADFANNPKLASQWLRGSRGGGTSRVWRPPAYLSPDYAELSQAVKATFEQKLGRAPSKAEVTLLSNKMKADHRGEFDAQVEGQRLQFFGSGGHDAGTVQDVNYAARFQEDFENKYTNELGTIDRADMQQNVMQDALGSILSIDNAIGY